MAYYQTPPPPATAATPWWRTPTALFLIGVLIAAAIAVPVVFLVLRGDDEGSAAGSSTTAPTTTAATSTTGVATTTSSTTTTTEASTTSSTTTAPTTTTSAAGDQLDPEGEPYYEELTMASGFLPDPWEYEIQSGGPVDVAYLGGDCVGFANEAPDFRWVYTAGSSSLRFYFVADTEGEDTTLIINSPDGTWVCNDDSYDTSNPTIDFLGVAPGGIYNIWIGSYDEGQFVDGTLYATELDLNHP